MTTIPVKPYHDWIMWGNNDSDNIVDIVLYEFNAVGEQHRDIDILIAYYSYEDYSGTAFVLYWDRKAGKWYEVHGGHCSCYGLEDQWSPEETTLGSVFDRREKGGWYVYGSDAVNEEILETVHRAIEAGWEDGPVLPD